MPSSSIYGLRVESNRPIPGVRLSTPARCHDLRISLGSMPEFRLALEGSAKVWYSSSSLTERGEPSLVITKLDDGAWVHLHYGDGSNFLVDRLGTMLWAAWPETLTTEDAATYLLGPVMGVVLLLRGSHCLHASAINVGGRAVALVGPAGAGKSTAAAAFAKLGYSVLSDDVLILAHERGELMVQPAYPCIRLWPESVEALFGKRDALPLLTPNWDKRYLDLTRGENRFQAHPLPLAAIYFLGKRSTDAFGPTIEAMAPQSGLIELVANAYALQVKDKAARAKEFEVFGRVAANVPLRRAFPTAALRDISRLCEVVLKDFRALPQPGAAPNAADRFECV